MQQYVREARITKVSSNQFEYRLIMQLKDFNGEVDQNRKLKTQKGAHWKSSVSESYTTHNFDHLFSIPPDLANLISHQDLYLFDFHNYLKLCIKITPYLLKYSSPMSKPTFQNFSLTKLADAQLLCILETPEKRFLNMTKMRSRSDLINLNCQNC